MLTAVVVSFKNRILGQIIGVRADQTTLGSKPTQPYAAHQQIEEKQQDSGANEQ